jgi:YD repeat-containing protein
VAITYTYDDNGNLSTKTDARSIVSTYAYDSLNLERTVAATSGDGDDFAHEENGNLYGGPIGLKPNRKPKYRRLVIPSERWSIAACHGASMIGY